MIFDLFLEDLERWTIRWTIRKKTNGKKGNAATKIAAFFS